MELHTFVKDYTVHNANKVTLKGKYELGVTKVCHHRLTDYNKCATMGADIDIGGCGGTIQNLHIALLSFSVNNLAI